MKINDVITVKAQIMEIDDDEIGIKIEGNFHWLYFSHEKFPATIVNPVTWRDGAKEKPENSQELRVWVMKKGKEWEIKLWNTYQFHANLIIQSEWLWLYQSEFPMPATPEPEPVIEPCPFCSTDMDSNNCEIENSMWEINCGVCGYRTMEFYNKSEAIEAHNKISKLVRGAK